MLQQRGFWLLLMVGAIALWIAVFLVGILGFPDSAVAAPALLGVLFLMHCGELPVSLKIGKAKGLTTFRVVVKTVIFGFTWWVPLKKGVLDR